MDDRPRQSNFELMRIVAMFLIIACHFVSGITPPLKDRMPVNDAVIALYFPGGQVGVALFFILSGFFGERGAMRPAKAARIVLALFFYAWLALLFYALVRLLGIYDFPRLSKAALTECLVDALIPYSSGTWWFITAYIPLQLVKRQVNALLGRLSRTGLAVLLLALWFFWYSLANGYKGILSYFTFEKAVFFYAAGFFARREVEPSASALFGKAPSLALAALSYLGASAMQILYTGPARGPFPKIVFYAAQGAVFVPLSAFFLFVFFMRLEVKSSALVNRTAATTLGVYIFHRSNIMAHFFFRKLFDGARLYARADFPLSLTASVAAVFALCAAVEAVRARAVEPFVLGKLSAALARAKGRLLRG